MLAQNEDSMFGHAHASRVQPHAFAGRAASRDIKTYEFATGKAVKKLVIGGLCLLISIGILIHEFQYDFDNMEGKLLFAGVIFLIIGVVGVWVAARDISQRGEVGLQLTDSGIRAQSWTNELKWSEINDIRAVQTKTYGVVGDTSIYLIADDKTMARVSPGLLNGIGRNLTGGKGLRLPIEKIEGDYQSVGQLVHACWQKYGGRVS
jgi:hypothetical protein